MMKMACTSMYVLLVVCILSSNLSSAWLFSSSSGGRSSSRSYPHDIRTGSGLTSLYNRRVTSVERVERPLGGSSRSAPPLSHSGVVVTVDDGSRYLVHKGSDYGRSSSTVVTDASHMSDRWTHSGTRPVPDSTVSDFVSAGGSNYGLVTDNCHDATRRMLDLGQSEQ